MLAEVEVVVFVVGLLLLLLSELREAERVLTADA